LADTAPHDPPEQLDAPPPPSRRLGRWVKAAAGAIVGLGAVLAAIAGILDLVQKDPAPAAGVSFGRLELNAITLSDFQQTQKFTSAGLRWVHARLASTTLAQTDQDQSDEATTEDTRQCPSPEEVTAGATPPEGCPEGGQPCPTAEEVELGVEVPSGCPGAGLDCPTAEEVAQGVGAPDGCPASGTRVGTDPGDPDEATAELDQQYDMGRGCSGDPAGGRCALTAIAKSAGGGQGVSPARSIGRVRRVLAGTRSQLGPDGKRHPMGMMVSVDVTLTGMSGEPIELYWSMLSADTSRALPQSWLRNTRSATLHPHAEQAQLQKDLWLPLPRERGRYRARITLLNEDGERYSERTAVFH
jgi:hypothetical protein